MIIQDLGQLEGPFVLFGGCYSNLQATQAILRLADDMCAQTLIHTGDAIAYCADPTPVVQCLMDAKVRAIKGNCEIQLSENAPDCGCGFQDGTACDILSVQWYAFAQTQVTPHHRKVMADWPDWIIFTHSGKRYCVIHGGARAVATFIFSTAQDSVLQAEIDHIIRHIGACDAIVCGHSGIAFTRSIGWVEWINAGVIGMPPHDGDPRTQYCVLDNGHVEVRRLSYDHFGAADAMTDAGLPTGYRDALLTGYWPSEDVLPHQLRRDNG